MTLNYSNMKTCSKCKVEKPFSEFPKNRTKKYGLESQCKACHKAYREANKERIKEYSKAYQEANKEYYKAYDKAYREANKYRIKAQRKAHYEANKHRIKEYSKAHREDNKEYYKAYQEANKERIKERNKAYREANKDRINEYFKERRKTDPLFKLKQKLRTRTYKAFRNKGYRKNTKTEEMLGVSWEIAKAHIERQFKKGMTWDKYGEWHIDHIIPLASANTEKELKRLCHYTNLQPLWAEENLSKSAMILGQQRMLRI